MRDLSLVDPLTVMAEPAFVELGTHCASFPYCSGGGRGAGYCPAVCLVAGKNLKMSAPS